MTEVPDELRPWTEERDSDPESDPDELRLNEHLALSSRARPAPLAVSTLRSPFGDHASAILEQTQHDKRHSAITPFGVIALHLVEPRILREDRVLLSHIQTTVERALLKNELPDLRALREAMRALPSWLLDIPVLRVAITVLKATKQRRADICPTNLLALQIVGAIIHTITSQLTQPAPAPAPVPGDAMQAIKESPLQTHSEIRQKELQAKQCIEKSKVSNAREKEKLLHQALEFMLLIEKPSREISHLLLMSLFDLLPILSLTERVALVFLTLQKILPPLSSYPLLEVHRICQSSIPYMDKSQQVQLKKLSDTRMEISIDNYFTLLAPSYEVMEWFQNGPARFSFRQRHLEEKKFFWPSFDEIIVLIAPGDIEDLRNLFQPECRLLNVRKTFDNGKQVFSVRFDMAVYIELYRWLIVHAICFIDVFYDEHECRRYFLPDRVVVQCRESCIAGLDARIIPDHSNPKGYFSVGVLQTEGLHATLNRLSSSLSIEKVFPVEVQGQSAACCEKCIPGDPFFPQQWSLAAGPVTRSPRPLSPVLDLVRGLHVANSSAQLKTESVCISILDSGLVSDHPDLNHVKFRPDPEVIDTGHGTRVAEIISANCNKIGILGIAPMIPVELYQISLWEGTDLLQYVSVLQTLLSQAEANVRQRHVINISWTCANNPFVTDKIEELSSLANVIVVAAAGNTHTKNLSFPASCRNVLAVAGLDATNSKAESSSFGDRICISAPSADIVTTRNGNDLELCTGTSCAAAHVTGVCSLMWACAPNLFGTEIRERLLKTAGVITDCDYRSQLGRGFVDARFAIIAAVQGAPQGAQHVEKRKGS